MAKVHLLHTGVGANLILATLCHAFQTQSVAFVHLCSSVRQDKQGSNSNIWGWWADFTAFLWLGVMTVKMGALEGVFDVFVLFSRVRVIPTCINELMQCLMLAFKSPLVLWPQCPPLYPPSFLTHKRTLYTQSTSHTLIYIASRKHAALLSCWNEEGCAPVCFLCLYGRGKGGH